MFEIKINQVIVHLKDREKMTNFIITILKERKLKILNNKSNRKYLLDMNEASSL